jgi:hypothetical protein
MLGKMEYVKETPFGNRCKEPRAGIGRLHYTIDLSAVKMIRTRFWVS